MQFFWTIVALVVVLGLCWRYLGSYMAAVFEGRVHWLGFIERPVYWGLGTSPEQEQSWKRYAGSLVIFSAVSILLTYLIIRIQGSLPSTHSTSGPCHLPCRGIPRPRLLRTRTGRTTTASRRCRTSPRWPPSLFSSS